MSSFNSITTISAKRCTLVPKFAVLSSNLSASSSLSTSPATSTVATSARPLATTQIGLVTSNLTAIVPAPIAPTSTTPSPSNSFVSSQSTNPVSITPTALPDIDSGTSSAKASESAVTSLPTGDSPGVSQSRESTITLSATNESGISLPTHNPTPVSSGDSSSQSNHKHENPSSEAGLIAGLVLGILAFFAIMIFLWYRFRKRRRYNRDSMATGLIPQEGTFDTSEKSWKSLKFKRLALPQALTNTISASREIISAKVKGLILRMKDLSTAQRSSDRSLHRPLDSAPNSPTSLRRPSMLDSRRSKFATGFRRTFRPLLDRTVDTQSERGWFGSAPSPLPQQREVLSAPADSSAATRTSTRDSFAGASSRYPSSWQTVAIPTPASSHHHRSEGYSSSSSDPFQDPATPAPGVRDSMKLLPSPANVAQYTPETAHTSLTDPNAALARGTSDRSVQRRAHHTHDDSSVIILPSGDDMRRLSRETTMSDLSRWRRGRETFTSIRSDPFDLETTSSSFGSGGASGSIGTQRPGYGRQPSDESTVSGFTTSARGVSGANLERGNSSAAASRPQLRQRLSSEVVKGAWPLRD